MLRCVEPALLGEALPAASTLPQDPLLPRAMSIHRVRTGSDGQEWSILYDVVGRGTRWLASRQPGELVFCWGPLGHGYEMAKESQHLLLVGGGIGVAPLVWLADEAVARGQSVTMVLGGGSTEQIFPAALLPREVEVVVFTEDGSAGRQGLATEGFVEYLEWCDQAFASGRTPCSPLWLPQCARRDSGGPCRCCWRSAWAAGRASATAAPWRCAEACASSAKTAPSSSCAMCSRMNSPFLLQMAGQPGSGKSALARLIAKRTGAVALDKDVLKTAALDAGADESSAGKIAYEGFLALASHLLGQG